MNGHHVPQIQRNAHFVKRGFTNMRCRILTTKQLDKFIEVTLTIKIPKAMYELRIQPLLDHGFYDDPEAAFKDFIRGGVLSQRVSTKLKDIKEGTVSGVKPPLKRGSDK